MAKYDEAFRLKVVKRYLRGDVSAKAMARRYGVDDSMLRRWVASYQQHGRAGLKKKFSHYNAEFRLSVLKHMWREGLSHRQTTAVFDIRNAGSVGLWERLYHSGGIDALTPRPRGRPQTMPPPVPPQPPAKAIPDDERSRKQLLEEVAYLRAEVAYLKKLDALVQAKQAAQQKKRK